jgi:hypothetical protein
MKRIIKMLLLIILFTACKKNITEVEKPLPQTYDTIKPMAYYPAYPGSWWKYMVNGAQINTDTVGAKYQMHFYKNNQFTYDSAGNVVDSYSDTVYVPFLNGRPIYGYMRIEHIRPPFGDFYTQWPILSETVGFSFERYWSDKRYGDFSEKVRVANKFFDGQDSVLVLEGRWVYGPEINKKSYQKYAKGIGLIYEVIVDTTSQDTLFEKKLIDFRINH